MHVPKGAATLCVKDYDTTGIDSSRVCQVMWEFVACDGLWDPFNARWLHALAQVGCNILCMHAWVQQACAAVMHSMIDLFAISRTYALMSFVQYELVYVCFSRGSDNSQPKTSGSSR